MQISTGLTGTSNERIWMRMRSNFEAGLADFLTCSLLGLLILALVILLWLLCKACGWIWRAARSRPENKALRLSLTAFFAVLLMVTVTGGQLPLVNWLALVLWVIVAITAKLLLIYHDKLLLTEFDREVLVDDILHNSWV